MKRILLFFVFLLCVVLTQAAENYPYRSDYLWVTVPDHADWLYQCGEKATVEVQFSCQDSDGDSEETVVPRPEIEDDAGRGDLRTSCKSRILG